MNMRLLVRPFQDRLLDRFASRCTVVAAILAFTVWAGPAAASERQVVPFEMSAEGHMIVTMNINDDAQAEGVIDTAATYAMIEASAAKAAGVSPPSENTVSVFGLAGPETYPIVHVGSFLAGNARLTNISAALNSHIDVPGAHNILPINAFDGDIIDFDFSNGRILFYNGRPDKSTALIPSRIRIEKIEGLWFAEVKLNGTKGLALIDTGSSITYINTRFAEEAGTRADLEKTQTLRGATGGGVAVSVATARTFSVGRHRVSGLDLLVADPPLFTHLGLADRPAMVLGLDYLSAFRVQIDRRRGSLVLSRPDGTPNERSIRYLRTGSHISGD